MDEAQVGLSYLVLKCWMKRGEQKRIPMSSRQRRSQILACALNWRSDQIHCRDLQRLDSENIVTYLEWLLTSVSAPTLVLVLDNAAFHHSAAVQAALTCFEHRLLLL